MTDEISDIIDEMGDKRKKYMFFDNYPQLIVSNP